MDTPGVINLACSVMVIVFPAPEVAIPSTPLLGVNIFKILAAGTAVPESVGYDVATLGGRGPLVVLNDPA